MPTSLLGDTEHAFLLNEVRNNNVAALSRERTEDERRIYESRKKFEFTVQSGVDVATGKMQTNLLYIMVGGRYVIFPKRSKVTNILALYYKEYKGEGATKLHRRISESYFGVSRRNVQHFLNTNKEHFMRQPQFTNVPPLQPVISHTVNSRHQIDLVSFHDDPQLKDGIVYSYVLSVLDVFSRFLFLRPTTLNNQEKSKKSLLVHISKCQFDIY